MKFSILGHGLLVCIAVSVQAADNLKSKTTYAKAYGETKNAVTVDPAKDLPRYPAVSPKDSIATWQVKKGFHLELAASEPQLRSPVALCFDESGRMFASEMIDYSEMRDATPHLGRVSVLQDKDGDGHFETSQVFADDLAWPTGLIWANGGLYVIATPDIWFFQDKDGDGKAEIREKVFTGFGTGLKILNVQGLANSPQWGLDNRIHILAGGGNRGVVTCLKRPDLKGIELGGRDFWFDPRTHEFGLEAGGAQYGMSFDNYGRKFGCSNSDHLQYWVYDDKYAGRNPFFQMPPSRQSIAVDGGAAEVFRLSPDEPWRIIRTRWRIAGVVKGAVEGGGRVSGYFTGASGTTIYRGDAYGPEFVNNSFSGDAGGQLVHRKIIRPSEDGVSLAGERPADEHGFEFAASKDTWVRVVNFANAPDGCLHIIDMHREVIEHPWSIPDEIKKHIDLNNGNDMGRIFRIAPDNRDKWRGTKVNLNGATVDQLVQTLGHSNGWHRDTAQRLLYERNDKAAVPLLKNLIHGASAVAKLHALGALAGCDALDEGTVLTALKDSDAHVREAAVGAFETMSAGKSKLSTAVLKQLAETARDASVRVRYRTMLAAGSLPHVAEDSSIGWEVSILCNGLLSEFHRKVKQDGLFPEIPKPLVVAAASAGPETVWRVASFFPTLSPSGFEGALDQIAPLVQVAFSSGSKNELAARLEQIGMGRPAFSPAWIKAILTGLKRAGVKAEDIDAKGLITSAFAAAAKVAASSQESPAARREAIELLGLAASKESSAALLQALGKDQPEAVQTAAVKVLAQNASPETTRALLNAWPNYADAAGARAAATEAMLARDDRAIAFLESGVLKPADFAVSQVQALVHHKNPKVVAVSKTVLASVIPPSREEVIAKFKPVLTLKGDATKGQTQYMLRCLACHRAGATGIAVGPDLITVKTKGRDGILSAILEPHKEVAAQFIAYVVNTKDGQTLSGVVTKDDANSMTLKMMGGAEVTLQRSQIKGSSSSGQSLMPEGLETGMSVQDMADLLEFIEALR